MPEEQYQGVVLYTDGSAKPNPGFTGWGMHGYFYNTLASERRIVVAKHHLPTKIGYIHQNEVGQNPRAVLVEPIKYIDGFGTGKFPASNNHAEVSALYNFLIKLKEYDVKEVQILTDSDYLRKGATELKEGNQKTQYSNYNNTGLIPNADLWKPLHDMLDELAEKGIIVNIDWVKGHNDIYGNMVADYLATIGMAYATDGRNITDITVSDIKGYWKHEIDRHPFISFRRLYFNSQNKYNIIGQYYQAETGKDEMVLGKRMPETSYCVLKLKIPDPVIETIRQKQFEISGEMNSIMMMKLDRIYDPDVYKYIQAHTTKTLLPNYKSIGLDFIDKKPITIEMKPANLSPRAIESMSFLERLLESYLEDKDTSRVKMIDITGHFYEEVPDKKGKATYKLRQEFGVGVADTNIMIATDSIRGEEKNVKVKLLFGSDILHRNSLKKIETMHPRITLVTWYESEMSIRYATVIEIDSGVGIWSNFYSNRVFI